MNITLVERGEVIQGVMSQKFYYSSMPSLKPVGELIDLTLKTLGNEPPLLGESLNIGLCNEPLRYTGVGVPEREFGRWIKRAFVATASDLAPVVGGMTTLPLFCGSPALGGRSAGGVAAGMGLLECSAFNPRRCR